jgi:esterase
LKDSPKILHSQIIGEGFPFIILHGFLGSGDNWKSMGKRIAAEGFQAHLVDQRNHGRSFHDDGFSYQLMADDLKKYCDYHKLEEFYLLGHSMGGKTAMLFAVTYPERVKKLIVADIGPKAYPQHHQNILKALSLLDFSKINTRDDAEEILSKYIKEGGIRQFLMKNLYWVQKGILGLRINLPVLREKIEEIGKCLAKNTEYPGETLFLRGSKSEYIVSTDDVLIKKHFPRSHTKTVSNAGHWLHAENPDEFFLFVANFL